MVEQVMAVMDLHSFMTESVSAGSLVTTTRRQSVRYGRERGREEGDNMGG